MIDFTYFHLLFGIALLLVILVFLGRQQRSLWYLLFFSMFWIYLLFVFSVIAFPIVPLDGIHRVEFRLNMNFIPFYFGSCSIMPELCLRGIVENILLTVPFGLGIPFIARLRWKDFLWLAPLVGFGFELLQLIIALLFRSPFRIVDINDVLLNGLGVWIGYSLFRIFGSFYLFVTRKLEIRHQALFAYVYEVVRQSQ